LSTRRRPRDFFDSENVRAPVGCILVSGEPKPKSVAIPGANPEVLKGLGTDKARRSQSGCDSQTETKSQFKGYDAPFLFSTKENPIDAWTTEQTGLCDSCNDVYNRNGKIAESELCQQCHAKFDNHEMPGTLDDYRDATTFCAHSRPQAKALRCFA